MSSVQRAREARTGEDPIIGGPDRFSDQMKIQNPLIRRVRCWWCMDSMMSIFDKVGTGANWIVPFN